MMETKPAHHTFSAMAILIVALMYHLSMNAVQGNMECEELSVEDCAFAVASSGARCVLEKHYHKTNAKMHYKCQTSIIMAERGAIEWIETDACIQACGLTRMWVGLSTDALLERQFMKGLCSTRCRIQCPNIMDLFTKLAAEEGVYLPRLCDSLEATETLQKHMMETRTKTPTSRRELKEDKQSTTLQSLQDMNGDFPAEPPFNPGAPHPQEPWVMHAEPPYPFEVPHAQPPYPFGFPHAESPFPNDHVEPPYPYEPPNPYEPVEPPFPYGPVEPPFPFAPVEPPYPLEEPPFIFGEPPYPQAPYVPPYFIEPPNYQEPSDNNYGQPPIPDFSSESPIYTQPEPILVAPGLPPSYLNDGF